MKKAAGAEIKRGQAISFRLPSDTPNHLLKQLQKLKETERRNFSSKIAEFVLQGVSSSVAREKETITIPLPRNLTKAQRDWLKHEHSEALLGSIVYHLITDPVRSTALLASLNSRAVDIDEALYLQEDVEVQQDVPFAIREGVPQADAEIAAATQLADFEDDLDSFDWESAVQAERTGEEKNMKEEHEAEDLDDLLGGFLASMNK